MLHFFETAWCLDFLVMKFEFLSCKILNNKKWVPEAEMLFYFLAALLAENEAFSISV